VVASRWSLQRDERGTPVAILETNNDITERRRAEEALRRLNRELRAISDCNQTLLHATDEHSLLEEICRIVCEEAGYRMAWVAYAEHDEAKSVRPEAWTGAEKGYLANLGITWADTELGRSPTGTAIRSGKTCCIEDFATDPRMAPWRENALQRGFRSAIALPLKDEHANAFGSLGIYSAQPNAFTPEEVRLLEELAADLAFGIVTLSSRAARERAEQALRQSEAYLAEAQRLTHAGSWALDLAGEKYVYVSEEDFRIWGFDPQEGLPTGEAVSRRIHPEDRNRWKENFERALREKVDSFDEYRIVLPDGTMKHIYTIRHPVVNDAGDVVELVGTSIDVTEHKRAEEALRQSEAYLADAQRLSHSGSFAFDMASNKYVYISEECLRIFELDAQQSLKPREAVSRFIHPEDWDRVQGDFEKLLREKVDTPSEFRIVPPSGAAKHIQVIRHPVLNGAGEVVTIVGTAIDITERKRAEEALRLSNAYNRGLIEASLDPLVTIGPDGKIADVNAATEAATGRSRGELIGTDFCDYFTEPANARAGYEQVFREGLVRDYPLDLRHRDGHVMSVSYNAAVYRDASGEVGGVFAAARDITERKRAEEALRESETRFRTFVDHAADAFFILDSRQGTIIDVNRRACETLGYARQELIGMTPLVFDTNLDRATLESIAERAAGETVWFDRHWHRRKDGSLFPVEVQTSVIWHGGRPYLLKVARDISDRLRAEEQRDRLRQLEADLAHINRVSLLGELAASIAHEINQPISGVVSNGSACLRWLARDVPDVEEAREAARRIVRDGKRAGEVIARIRALTKRAATLREKLDLNETIREILPLVGDEAKRNSVIIQTQLADDLSHVSGDRVELQQLVLNLVINAIEAMSSVADRARELLITTRNIDPDQVQVTVEDSGTGLDPSTVEKIFDPFYTTKPGGMGMGLSISRSILQAHGGRLWATAKDGAGTIFHFALPSYHEEGLKAGIAPV